MQSPRSPERGSRSTGGIPGDRIRPPSAGLASPAAAGDRTLPELPPAARPDFELDLDPGTSRLFSDLRPGSRQPNRRRLRDLVGRDFPEPEARAHWRAIVRARDELERALGRDVSVAVAALDYFTRPAPDAAASDAEPADMCLLPRRTLATLKGLLRTDPLTGALNRRGLDSHLTRELSRAARTGEPLAVLACDVDRFKEANDRHGHPWGDQILQRLARLLLGHCRASDAVARLGGDEFLLLLPGTDLAGALALAERIHEGVRGSDLLRGCPTSVAGQEPLTISIGAASGELDERALLAQADAALYRAKRAGRGRSAA